MVCWGFQLFLGFLFFLFLGSQQISGVGDDVKFDAVGQRLDVCDVLRWDYHCTAHTLPSKPFNAWDFKFTCGVIFENPSVCTSLSMPNSRSISSGVRVLNQQGEFIPYHQVQLLLHLSAMTPEVWGLHTLCMLNSASTATTTTKSVFLTTNGIWMSDSTNSHINSTWTFFSIMVTTSGSPPTTFPRSKTHTCRLIWGHTFLVLTHSKK